MNNNIITKEQWFSKPHFYEILLNSNTLPKEPVIAELGVWVGNTTNHLINELKNRGYNPKDYVIDIFTGSPEHVDMIKAFGGNTLNEFQKNVKENNNERFVTIVNKTTNEASKDFPDFFFDYIYIDADHSYESVRQDIYNWWPKLKLNRYFSGDDYGLYGWQSVTQAVDSIFSNIDCNHVIFHKLKTTIEI